LTDGFEEIETLAPVDLLRRAGVEVLLVSLTGRLAVKGRCDVVIQADKLLEAGAEVERFDLLLLPGGPGVKTLRTDGRAAQLARSFIRQGRDVAAICAAPTILHDAGLLAGRRFTAHFSVHAELPQALAGERVVEDGSLITSRGAGTALEFGLALVRRLCGEAAEREVATAIML
jgi:4-methyl-5(b-hydroxyethyl)-thiazole monophosphate biosynthesis